MIGTRDYVLGSHGVSLDTKKLCWVEVTPDTPGTPTTDPVPPVKILIRDNTQKGIVKVRFDNP